MTISEQHIKAIKHVAKSATMLLTALMFSGLWSCSDVIDGPGIEGTPNALTLRVSSSALAVNSRATNDGDNEYYMETVDVFLYPANSSEESVAAYHLYKEINAYGEETISSGLDDSEISAIFPDSDENTCIAYTVANVHDKVQALIESNSLMPTIAQLKAIALETKFPEISADIESGDATDFGPIAMSATSTVTMNANKALSGSVSLERAIAKIYLELYVASEIKVETGSATDSEGDTVKTYKTYAPALTTDESTVHPIDAKIMNSATKGLMQTRNDGVEGMVKEVGERGLSASTDNYMEYYDAEAGGEITKEDVTYYKYVQGRAFYSYPHQWDSNLESEETALKLDIRWIASDDASAEVQRYYYQIPINYDGMKLERNHSYKIKLNVGMLGSTSESEPIVIDEEDMHYEVLNWGDEDSKLTAELSKNHYLVAEDNSFTLWNESTLSFTYACCQDLSDVILAEVSYEKETEEADSTGTLALETVYLYQRAYNSTTHTYADANSITTSSVSTTGEKTAVEYLQKLVVSKDNNSTDANLSTAGSADYPTIINVLDTQLDENNEAVSLGSGTIYFNSDVAKVASQVYRPVTYTILLFNNANHNGIKQMIKITQYPSKYIEYGPSDNVIVNGYFAKLAPDNGYSNNGDTWMSGTISSSRFTTGTYYKSYTFTLNGYTYNNGDIYFATRSNTNSESLYNSEGYGSSYLNTSYNVLSLRVSGEVTFPNTIDVYVTAFTSEDKTFAINGEDRTYVLGDPRQKGEFTTWSSTTYGNSTKHNPDEKELYGYLTKCEELGSGNDRYRRYVTAWDNDVAQSIRIGGAKPEYDNIIAPLFKMQSTWGFANYTSSFNVAQKRCATYQEAGYPAGRWRLPTLAEIAYIVSLQNNGIINKMFITEDAPTELNGSNIAGYWTSSDGRIVVTADGMDYTSGYTALKGTNDKYTNNCWTRCVYDLWYWQDGENAAHQTLPTHQYHIAPTASQTGSVYNIINRKRK